MGGINTGLIIAALTGTAAVIAAVNAIIKPIRDLISDINAIKSGMKSIYRCNMLATYYKWHDQDTIKQYEKEKFIVMYNAYKTLGGNGFMDTIYKEVSGWEVIE